MRRLSRNTTLPYRRAATRKELSSLKKVVSANRLERKQFYGTGNTANVFSNTPQVINLAGAIAQGAGYNQRLGRDIRISRVRISCRWTIATAVDRAALMGRTLVIKSKQQTFNTAPTSSTVLLDDTQSWRSMYNPDQVPDKYAIVEDKMATKYIDYSAQLPEVFQTFDMKFSTPHKLQWSLDTDDIISGGLYAMFCSNQPTNAPTVYWQVIVDFTD